MAITYETLHASYFLNLFPSSSSLYKHTGFNEVNV